MSGFPLPIRRKSRGVGIGKHPVVIPLHILNIPWGKQSRQSADQVFLNFRVDQIQNALISPLAVCPTRSGHSPVWVLFIQAGLRIHHFRFYPQAKAQSKRTESL